MIAKVSMVCLACVQELLDKETLSGSQIKELVSRVDGSSKLSSR